jgi:hypothetical protein
VLSYPADTLKISFRTFHLSHTEKHPEQEYDGTPSRKKDGISPKQKQLKKENGGETCFCRSSMMKISPM